MHSIHTTLGFIIESRPYGEAGKILYIFTRDFGLIVATAQGIRFEKSKLRYHTQEYSFGTFSLVRGKEYWRLTSAAQSVSESGVEGDTMKINTGARYNTYELIARLALLLRRLLHGEEAHPELFDCIRSCVQFIERTEISEEQLKTLESVTVLRMLALLGYIGKDPLINQEIKEGNFSIQLLETYKEKRMLLNQHINKALRESHL